MNRPAGLFSRPSRCKTRLCLLAGLFSLILLAGCPDEWVFDGSYPWGGAGGGAGGGLATGWFGDGGDNWKNYDGAAPNIWPASFDSPQDLFVAGNGHVYIADTGNHRVCHWDTNAAHLGWLGDGTDGWHNYDGPSFSGDDDFSFSGPAGIFVWGYHIYVADTQNHRISKWTLEGDFVGWIGGSLWNWQSGTAPDSGSSFDAFDTPHGLFVTPMGDIFVADSGNNRITRWAWDGTPVHWIGGNLTGWQTGSGAAISSQNQGFDWPRDVFLNTSGQIFVADSDNSRVCRWEIATGTCSGWIGSGTPGWNTGSGAIPTDAEAGFDMPTSVFVHPSSGDLYVADYWNHRIQRFDDQAQSRGWIGGGSGGWKSGPGTGFSSHFASFNQPAGVFLGSTTFDFIYVADQNNHRVSRWDITGTSSETWDTSPPDPIIDLSAGMGSNMDEIDLSWTAVGDDGTTGQAVEYVIKYDTNSIDDSTWHWAFTAPQNKIPLPSGSGESHTISGLNMGVTYYFAIKVVDKATNISALSTVVSFMIPPS